MNLSNQTYDLLKRLAQYGLPGLAALVAAIGEIWALSITVQIVLTINAINVFLGLIIKYSARQYGDADGNLEVESDVSGRLTGVTFNLNGATKNMDDLVKMDRVTFLIKSVPTTSTETEVLAD